MYFQILLHIKVLLSPGPNGIVVVLVPMILALRYPSAIGDSGIFNSIHNLIVCAKSGFWYLDLGTTQI